MVLEAYAQQFRKDFRHFLELRAKELVTGGQMVVSIIGRHSDGFAPFHLWDILAQVLSLMASEVQFLSFSSIEFYHLLTKAQVIDLSR
jgi:hypothetical protein